MVSLAIDTLESFDTKLAKGRCYTFNKVLPRESCREMSASNLVTEQWSERFMAGY